MKKTITFFGIILLSITSIVKAQVPPQWDTAKAQLTLKLNQINTEILNRWDNQPYCMNFSSNLIYANSNRGYSLFTFDPDNYPYPIPAYQNLLYAYIDTMLMAFDTLGLTAVDITVNYPLLVTSFKNSQYYLDFYKTVAQKVKQKGFKLMIECQATFVDSAYGEPNMVNDIQSYYFNPDNNALTDDTLDFYRFRQDKLQMMQTILDSLSPDFLTFEMEPQTEQANLYNLIEYSPDSVVSLINFYTANLQVNNNTLVGAGAGSWDNLEYFEKIAQTNIDFINYHIYPPHFNYVNTMAFLIDSIADANNKKLIIGEAWCYKATDYEVSSITNAVATSDVIFSRDVFDYWQGIDTLFVNMLALLSQQSKIDAISMFWPYPFFGQLTYNSATHGTMTPTQILNTGQQYAYQNMNQFILSPVGVHTKNMIASICIPSTGLTEYTSKNQILFYPNPTNDILYIQTKENINSIMVFNYIGELILFDKAGKNLVNLPATIQNGIYLVRVQTDNGIVTKKIIIER